MKPYVIHVPIWNNDGKRSVGIADYRLKKDALIEISYKDKDGNKLYPYYYFMNKHKAKQYPVQKYKGLNLHIIPIEDFEIVEPKGAII